MTTPTLRHQVSKNDTNKLDCVNQSRISRTLKDLQLFRYEAIVTDTDQYDLNHHSITKYVWPSSSATNDTYRQFVEAIQTKIRHLCSSKCQRERTVNQI